jgi:sec-independent protein translocase protein TatC
VPKVIEPIKNSVKSITDLWKSDLPDDYIEDEEMSLLQHLEEIRSRIVKMAVALVVMTAVGWLLTPTILTLIKATGPANVEWLAIEPTENIVTWFKVAIVTGIGLATPVLLWQIIGFVAPGLTRREKRLLFSMLPLVLFFFLLGSSFGYLVTLPFALRFLLGFGTEFATAAPTISKMVTFVLTILFWMGISFELPVVVYVLAALRIVTPRRLVSFRKYAILIFFVIAAIITPTPDPLNQTFVAAPMIVLYEVGILMARTIKQPTE